MLQTVGDVRIVLNNYNSLSIVLILVLKLLVYVVVYHKALKAEPPNERRDKCYRK